MTFRVVGPDSNGSFRSAILDNQLSLINIHSNTDQIIPELATHWAFGKDKKTMYFKLDKDARWSDGRSVTAWDYVYTLEFMRSDHIIAPWYNDYYTKEIEAVIVYDDYTLGVKSTKAVPDLHMKLGISPTPAHYFGRLDETYVQKYNWEIVPNTGAYQIDEFKKGKFINFEFNIYIYSMKDNKLNLSIFFGFLLIAFLGILYGNEIKSSYDGLRIWSVENILWLGTVIPFLMLQSYVGIPNLFQRNISNKKRLLQPILIGAAFGILDILVIKIIQHPQPYTELPPFLQPFPYSIFLYFSGALEIEIFYRLIPITLMLLIGKKVSNGYYFNYFYGLQ